MIIVLLNLIWAFFYLIETKGMERNDIFNKLRGIKVQNQDSGCVEIKEDTKKEKTGK